MDYDLGECEYLWKAWDFWCKRWDGEYLDSDSKKSCQDVDAAYEKGQMP